MTLCAMLCEILCRFCVKCQSPSSSCTDGIMIIVIILTGGGRYAIITLNGCIEKSPNFSSKIIKFSKETSHT